MSNLQGLTSANSLYHGRAGELVRREATTIGGWLGIRPKEAANHRETITVAYCRRGRAPRRACQFRQEHPMRPSRLIFFIAVAVIAFGSGQTGFAFAQAKVDDKGAPAAAPSTPSTPPAAPSKPAESASPAPAPAPPPAAQAQPGSLVAEEVTLTEQPIVYLSSTATWDKAFETIIDSFKKVYAYLEKEKIAPAGPPMTIYTSTDDKGFQFRAAVPVAAPPANLTDGMTAGKSPTGKALKYVHRGTYDSLDSTYEAITNQLDEKGLEAQDIFVETYLNDPRTTPDDQLAIEVYVPIK
jgi:effector-binding domain-containing protein